MRRRPLFRFVALGLGAAIAIILAELVLRVSIPSSHVSLFEYRAGTARCRVMRPNVRGDVYGVAFETNEAGFRARAPFVTPKPAGSHRIVVIGDSFTSCAGIRFDDLATARLEQRLHASFPSLRAEVLNLGTGGHELPHHLATLREAALPLQPDLVLLALYPFNDFDLETHPRDCAFVSANVSERGPALAAPIKLGLDSLYVVRFLGPRLKSALAVLPFVGPSLSRSHLDDVATALESDSAVREAGRANLAEMAAAARAAGVPLLAYVLPSTSHSFESQRQLGELAVDVGRSAGVPVVSFADGFVKSGLRERDARLNLVDAHPNAEYNDRVAELLLDLLRSSGSLDEWTADSEVEPR